MGREHFWFTVIPIKEVEEGTDRWAVQHDLISITPLRLGLTNVDELARINSRFPGTNGKVRIPPKNRKAKAELDIIG